MAIRVYFCKWFRVGNRITNPINNALDPDVSYPGLQWISYHYGPSNAQGEPTKDMCFVFVKGTDFSVIDAIPNTWKLPTGHLNHKLNKPQRVAIMDFIGPEFDLPADFLDDCVTRKDAVNKFALHVHPDFVGFGNVDDAEFE